MGRLEGRVERLEGGDGGGADDREVRRGIGLFSAFANSKHVPASVRDRRTLVEVGCTILGGVHDANAGGIPPKSATHAELLKCYQKGLVDPLFFDEQAEPAPPPPTPPLWLKIERDLREMLEQLPPRPAGDTDGIDRRFM
jgi:hypothetical protein